MFFLTRPVSGVLGRLFLPLQRASYKISQKTPLQQENVLTVAQNIATQKKLEEDNKALRDQFLTASVSNTQLLPAHVIGAPGFVPGVTQPTYLTLDLGEASGVKLGQAVVYKDNVIGNVTRVSKALAVVSPISRAHTNITAKTVKTSAIGILKGQGDTLLLDNVVLSDTLTVDDIVVTKGDVNENGVGFPPNLVIGKIVSVDKKPSALFQKARVKSLLDISKLSTVFVIRN